MKKSIFVLISMFLLLLSGCLSSSPTRSSEKVISPRRTFESVENIDASAKEPFIVQDYIHDGISYSKGSICYSTALFLSDLGILEGTSKNQFNNYMSVFFSKLPQQEQIKEIVIPNLSKSDKEDDEKNAYLFITKRKNEDGKDYYLVESNIPISSIYARTYDGYTMKMNAGFYKEKIPGNWTSIMSLRINNDILIYRGMAYLSKSSPLIVSETMGRVVSATRMDEVLSGKSTIAQIKNKLKEEVDKILENADQKNVEQNRSLTFLKKYTNLSLSAYSYIDNTFKEAREYYLASEKIIVDIPDDSMGSRYNELKKIMNYLLYTIGE